GGLRGKGASAAAPRAPSARSRSTRVDPMKPAPPVTSARTDSSLRGRGRPIVWAGVRRPGSGSVVLFALRGRAEDVVELDAQRLQRAVRGLLAGHEVEHQPVEQGEETTRVAVRSHLVPGLASLTGQQDLRLDALPELGTAAGEP